MDEVLATWILPYSPRVLERRGPPPAAAEGDDGAGGPGGAANGGGPAGSGPGGGASPCEPSAAAGHRNPRAGQGALYHPPALSSVVQVLTPAEMPAAALCNTSEALTDTVANAVAQFFSFQADMIIGVPAGCMIATLLLTISLLGQ